MIVMVHDAKNKVFRHDTTNESAEDILLGLDLPWDCVDGFHLYTGKFMDEEMERYVKKIDEKDRGRIFEITRALEEKEQEVNKLKHMLEIYQKLCTSQEKLIDILSGDCVCGGDCDDESGEVIDY